MDGLGVKISHAERTPPCDRVTMVISNHRKLVQMSFKSLVNALSEQRNEIKQALTLFPYFDTWDHKAIAECCQQSKIVEYSPDEIILGSGSANSQMTFFILEGVCKIIHHLLVRVKVDSYGRTSYNLYTPEDVGPAAGQSTNLSYTSLLFNEKHNFQREDDGGSQGGRRTSLKADTGTVDQADNGEIERTAEENAQQETGSAQNADSEVAENKEVETTPETENLKTSQQGHDDDDDVDVDHAHSEEVHCEMMENPAKENSSWSSTKPEQHGKEKNKQDEETDQNSTGERKQEEERDGEKVFEPDHHLRVLEECKAKSQQVVRLADEKLPTDKPKDLKSFFVQVALFYKGACFGLEENLKDTFIMSATKVKCLTIPRRFLLQHNPCNIWNRIRLFFSLYLPQEKQILEYVKSDRGWANATRKKSQEITSLKRIPNYILCAEVPFSIRLQDMPR